ncbi:spindle pole body formation-associated protein-domain-containing protein [Xylogone sp. PMI_703]|nr:spindle pole body formation-associated protein-domain-containing protein [Xylogone sp. PMI_703]
MLNWLLGKPTDVTSRVEDGDPEYEPPATPAPVFAARALKSAIFGTPAPLEDDVTNVIPNEPTATIGKATMASQTIDMSPAKPPGILLTPGTATSKRKTVTFGSEVVDKEEVNADAANKSASTNQHASKFPSPWTPRIRSQKKTSLTRTLENSRLGRKKTEASKDQEKESHAQSTGMDVNNERGSIHPGSITSEGTAESGTTNQPISKTEFDPDVTLDLNEPHSSSGKYWKSEYERYHEAAKAEMKNLFRYKQLAKSYAKKKDAEAIDLSEKLKEEQRKVAIMEERITKLVTRIASRGVPDEDSESPDLMKQLAWQTTLAVEYRNQVNEFQSTLAAAREENHGIKKKDRESAYLVAPSTNQILEETSMELKKAQEQLKNMTSLREEVESLKLALYAADQTTTKLREEKVKLSQELAEMKSTHEASTKECLTLRERLKEEQQKNEELLPNLQRDHAKLKEQAKAQRREAERLLKKRHDQVAGLKKDLAAMKEMTVNLPNPERTAPKVQIEPKREDPIDSQYQDIDFQKRDLGAGKLKLSQENQEGGSQDQRPVSRGQGLKSTTQTEPGNIWKTDAVARSYSRPTAITEKRKSDIASQPLRHLALSEIHNGVSDENDRLRPKSMILPTLLGTTPRYSLESPHISLPAFQPPPAFNASDQLHGMDVSRSRTQLPPEREAAAKARLQARLAKRRAKALGGDKENIGAPL